MLHESDRCSLLANLSCLLFSSYTKSAGTVNTYSRDKRWRGPRMNLYTNDPNTGESFNPLDKYTSYCPPPTKASGKLSSANPIYACCWVVLLLKSANELRLVTPCCRPRHVATCRHNFEYTIFIDNMSFYDCRYCCICPGIDSKFACCCHAPNKSVKLTFYYWD
jgi:hypothetical protein